MRRTVIAMLTIFLFASLSPIALAASTETQFADGTTDYENIFTQSGGADTPGITLPVGANVQSAQFTVEGAAATTSYVNQSQNANWGGPSTSDGSFSAGWFGSGYRYDVNVGNDEVTLRPQPTTRMWGLDRAADVASTTGGVHDVAAGTFATASNDMIGTTTADTISLGTGGSWSYAGPIAKVGDKLHTIQWYSSSIYNQPDIEVYNATTNQWDGQVNIQLNSCSTYSLRYLYDIAADGNDTIWAVSYSYRYISKWTVSNSTWSCDNSWSISSNRDPVGVSVDPITNKLYLLTRYYNSGNQIELWEVNRSSPGNAVSTTTLGTISSGTPSGLAVQMPRITVNIFCTYTSSSNCQARSWHSIYLDTPQWPVHQGDILYPNTAHYGIDHLGDGEIGFTCFYTTYCGASQTRKVHTTGAGAVTTVGTPSSNTAVVTSNTETLTSMVNSVGFDVAILHTTANSSIEFEISNDGGNSWRAATYGAQVSFPSSGNQIVWRAYLNGTSSEVPILDTVGLTYTTTYTGSGHLRMYKYIGSSAKPVAAQVWWNASTPGGSSITVYFASNYNCGTPTWSVPSSGSTVDFENPAISSYLTLCVYLYAGGSNGYTPTLEDINVSLHLNAPTDVRIDIGGDNSNEWTHQGSLIGVVTASSSTSSGNMLDDALNDAVPGTGSGTVLVPIKVRSASSGIVRITSFSVTYSMQTVNLDMQVPENTVFHERQQSYMITTRHVIGEGATGISTAQLSFIASPAADAPTLTWNEDGTLIDDDPEDWITPDTAATWTNNSNGIFEIHWAFRVTDDFPEQDDIGLRVTCTDDNNYSPAMLSIGSTGISVNQSYGLGWLSVRDVEGEVTRDNVENDMWVAAGETLYFQGSVWFVDTEDAPLNSVFDVRVARKDSAGDFVGSGWKDSSNPDGAFFVPVDVPEYDMPEGVTFEVQTFNERDPTKVMPANDTWRRTIRVDATAPSIVSTFPVEGGYEAASEAQPIIVEVEDAVGSPTDLTLNYWVEADHDSNRNGAPDADEYVNHTMTNTTEDGVKFFFSSIDDSRNPNMARVSYFVTGTDPAGNLLTNDDGAGFSYDLSTYRTRKDMASVFTGVDWIGHSDGATVFAGTDQTISVGLVDANGVIDFEEISLIFDFEGPDPDRDQQVISFSGRNQSFWAEGSYLELLPESRTTVTTNDTGLPWIMTTFAFRFSWDWPDEDISDLALVYKELGAETPTRHEFLQHTFRVENDLVLDAQTYSVEDVAEPRVGTIDDATPVRPDDRLRWSGRVVYEGSDVPAPSNLGITIEVFDGVQYWSDGSLTSEGGFSIEVPLSAAPTLQSAETRTFLSGIRNVPGRGEDMTRDTVATTLQLTVDHTPPRVHHRLAPIDVIDISATSTLDSVPVAFRGWEECVLEDDEDRCGSLMQSPQWVNWVMRDEARTIAAGRSMLTMSVVDSHLEWFGEVDLTSGGVVTPRSGYRIGFWVTGHDAAGNEFPMAANTESDPVREAAEDDGDHDLAWVRLGATVAELYVERVSVDNDVVSNGASVEITAIIANSGGATEGGFNVAFLDADGNEFHRTRLNGMPADSQHIIITEWEAEKGMDRVTVVVDVDDEIIEVDEDGNSMSAAISVEYAMGLGWIDSARQNPLTVIGLLLALIVLPIIGVVTWKNATAGSTSLYGEEDLYYDEDEDEDFDEDSDDEDDDGWE